MIHSTQDLINIASCRVEAISSIKDELRVCTGSSCLSVGAKELYKDLKKDLESDTTMVKEVGCNGLCANGILVSHKKDDTFKLYEHIDKNDIKLIKNAISKDKFLEIKNSDLNNPFFTKQEKIVLKNAGIVDPNDIEDYIVLDGYRAFLYALEELSSKDIIDEIKNSGLRGRGGGGYPTGVKWEMVAKESGISKYIICNGDEGDPGAFMDRAVMEADPHRVLEGMMIAGLACGANKGYIYVRAEYPLAVEKLTKAIKSAKKYGLLGTGIANSDFDFDIEIRLGGGAFVCGEATALITSIEGKRGHPRQKPPHLSHSGLWNSPTLLNNVETFANISSIIFNGSSWYSSFGTENSTGTKVFALTGHLKNSGLVEVPMGITLKELIYDIGGASNVKAIQTGGPSGGCIPEELLNTKVDYESLKSIGSIMGSGGLIVIDSNSNMVEVAKYFMDFCKSESCGKCTPCRVGTTQISDILQKIIEKKATKRDFLLLNELCQLLKDSSLCGLGKTAPNPVLSTINYFIQEYNKGIKNA
jgi:bidirectional [NiFe] hydrogenase diaphorase subunit